MFFVSIREISGSKRFLFQAESLAQALQIGRALAAGRSFAIGRWN